MRKGLIALIAIASILLIAALGIVGVFLFKNYSFDLQTPTEPCVIENEKTSTLILNTGDKRILTVDADDSVVDTLSFVSSDESVITVDSGGRVDAKKEGQATVSVKGDGYAGECNITVEKAQPKPEATEYTTAYVANLDVLEQNKADTDKNLYRVAINRRTNTVTVYTYDENGDYVIPVRAMVCSCGEMNDENITITGTFAVYFKEKWHPLFGDVYGQYVTGFSGNYLFHSVPYLRASANTLKTEEFNKLSTHASQGCIRLMVADAKWVYDNLDMSTVVEVVDDTSDVDVLGTPPVVKIPSDIKWDPTDPHHNNPYNKKAPVINGAKDVTLNIGDTYNPKITAVDTCSQDITDRIVTIGNVVATKKGTYIVTYSVTDDLKKTAEVTVKVTVK